jgi:hypothetical protein
MHASNKLDEGRLNYLQVGSVTFASCGAPHLASLCIHYELKDCANDQGPPRWTDGIHNHRERRWLIPS